MTLYRPTHFRVDDEETLLAFMTKESVPAGDKSCPTPLDQNIAFGREKKINGTPTIIFEDGERVPGAMAIADFEKKLAALKNPKVSSR